MSRFVIASLISFFTLGAGICNAAQEAQAGAGYESMVQTQDSTQARFVPLPANDLDVYGVLFKTVSVVAALSVLLYLVLRVYRVSAYGNVRSNRAFSAKLLGTSVIAPRKSVCVVQVLEHVLVLGLTGDQMNVLLELPVKELGEDLRKSLAVDGSTSQPGFKKVLGNLTGNL